MKRVLNKTRVFYFIMGLLILIVVSVTAVKFVNDFMVEEEKEVVTKVELDSLELYGYTLNDMDTELYKKYFEELKEILKQDEINMEDYASTLTKLFITDFYTLDNKITSSDFGGLEFIHLDLIENFKLNAGDTLYNHIKNNLYGDRVQDLPIVKEVTISDVTQSEYIYNEQKYDAYKVNANWNYEVDLGYENSGVFYLIKDNNKLNIVEKLGE